jgi:Transcriptional regulatory protein, C terminal
MAGKDDHSAPRFPKIRHRLSRTSVPSPARTMTALDPVPSPLHAGLRQVDAPTRVRKPSHAGAGSPRRQAGHRAPAGVVGAVAVNVDAQLPDDRVPPPARLPFQLVCGRAVYRSDTLRTAIIDGELVHFTPTEYRLLTPLLDHVNTPVSFKQLTQSVLNRPLDRDSRRLLDKHIDHIRSKIRAHGLNIHCVARFGYMLLPDQ